MYIRLATTSDAKQIQDIYQYYVEETSATFETVPPSCAEMARRMTETLKNYPYLVCVEGEQIIGYCYASAHNPRAAYRFNACLAVYLRQGYQGRKIGVLLYKKLIKLLKLQGICNVYGCITSENEGSIKMHSNMGFTINGVFHKTGYKFDRWIDVTWMEKRIQEIPTEFIPFSESPYKDER